MSRNWFDHIPMNYISDGKSLAAVVGKKGYYNNIMVLNNLNRCMISYIIHETVTADTPQVVFKAPIIVYPTMKENWSGFLLLLKLVLENPDYGENNNFRVLINDNVNIIYQLPYGTHVYDVPLIIRPPSLDLPLLTLTIDATSGGNPLTIRTLTIIHGEENELE